MRGNQDRDVRHTARPDELFRTPLCHAALWNRSCGAILSVWLWGTVQQRFKAEPAHVRCLYSFVVVYSGVRRVEAPAQRTCVCATCLFNAGIGGRCPMGCGLLNSARLHTVGKILMNACGYSGTVWTPESGLIIHLFSDIWRHHFWLSSRGIAWILVLRDGWESVTCKVRTNKQIVDSKKRPNKCLCFQ